MLIPDHPRSEPVVRLLIVRHPASLRGVRRTGACTTAFAG